MDLNTWQTIAGIKADLLDVLCLIEVEDETPKEKVMSDLVWISKRLHDLEEVFMNCKVTC